MPSPIFQEWLSHPDAGPFWDAYNPTAEQCSKLTLPILTITGMYDGDQPGALAHYRQHMVNASAAGRARHFLVIGPWDHAGTRTPHDEVGGIEFGPASRIDINNLHLQWYRWTMQNGPRPDLLQKPVAFYVTGSERWSYADSLEGITAQMRPFYLSSSGGNAGDVFASGALDTETPTGSRPDRYRYDPADTHGAALESEIDPDSLVDQRWVYARSGVQLVYHTAPFSKKVEVSGFFKLVAWVAIDQPDTDFSLFVSEILPDGRRIALSSAMLRARYRTSRRTPKLVDTRKPQMYSFDDFTFASRRISRGSRLRLTIGPVQSIYAERNNNTGGVVAQETLRDARRVEVALFHDHKHPSALYVPIAAAEDRVLEQ